jgi:hypothetical protein
MLFLGKTREPFGFPAFWQGIVRLAALRGQRGELRVWALGIAIFATSSSWADPAHSSPAPTQDSAAAIGQSASGLSPGVMLRLSRATYIREGVGKAERVVYVFIDPECPYCHELWSAIHSLPASVEVRYLMVAVISKASWGKAAAILESQDRAEALRKHESGVRNGGIRPLQEFAPEIRESIALNNLFLDALEIPGTPGIVYTDTGGAVRVSSGVPPKQLLNAIFSP